MASHSRAFIDWRCVLLVGQEGMAILKVVQNESSSVSLKIMNENETSYLILN